MDNKVVPTAYFGNVYVRVNDTDRSPNLNLVEDRLQLKRMFIQTTVGATAIGSIIQSFDIADIDGNGGNDIVACTVKDGVGSIYVINNTAAGLFATGTIWHIISDSKLNTNAIWIEGNKFFGEYNKFYTVTVGSEQVKRQYLDIVVGVKSSPSKVYGLISTYSAGKLSFGSLQGLSFVTQSKILAGSDFVLMDMVAADIDGNGRCDFLFATQSNHLIYWANYRGTIPIIDGNWPAVDWPVPGWQPYLVDQLTGATSSDTGLILDIDVGQFGV